MAAYQPFQSARLTEPDPGSLLTALRINDPTIGVQHAVGSGLWIFKKATDWAAADITAAQTALDTSAAWSASLIAQSHIDQWPIEFRALLLALLDQINVLRTRAGLATISPAQALQGVRDKAATLS